MGVNEGGRYARQGRTTVDQTLGVPQNKKIIIKASNNHAAQLDRIAEFNLHNKFWLDRRNDTVCLLIQPTVRIEYSQDSLAGIHIRKTARGSRYQDAQQYAEQIDYTINQLDSVLSIDPVYRLTRHNRYHAQEVEVTISLPAGTVVYLDPSLRKLLYAVENTEDTWSGDLVGQEWIMTPDGLAPVLQNKPAEKLD